MGQDDSHVRLGRWTPGELERTLRDSTGAGSDEGVGEADRFVCGVAQLLRRREAKQGASEDPPAISIFLLAPNPPVHAGLVRAPLLYLGETSLTGRYGASTLL